jgi:undecaprenyl-diphosphatase
MLILFGLILGLADKLGKREKTLERLNNRDGILYGFAQSLALIPGVSRSGATIALGRTVGYTREAALRYSFLLALPAVFGSGLYELKSAMDESSTNAFTLTETFGATVVAFIVGYSIIAWLMKFISTRTFTPFVIYRVVLGTALLVALATGSINAQ